MKKTKSNPVLRTKSTRIGYTLVGVSVPSSVSNYLNLYCIAYGVSKSSVFKSLLEDWIGATSVTENSDNQSLLNYIVKKVNKGWRLEKMNSKRTFTDYLTQITAELRKKGIDELQLRYILDNMKE